MSNALFLKLAALILLAAVAFGGVLYWHSERTADDRAPVETGNPEREACMERANALPESAPPGALGMYRTRAGAVQECQDRFGPP